MSGKTGRRSGQDEGVAFFAVFVHGAGDLHADARLDFFPGGFLQLVAEDAEMAARGADKVFVAAFAHLAEGFFGRHAAVHQPEVADFAVLCLELADERHLRALVGGVAGVDFVGQGEAVGRQDERDHHLQAVAALVAAVAVPLQVAVEGLGAVAPKYVLVRSKSTTSHVEPNSPSQRSRRNLNSSSLKEFRRSPRGLRHLSKGHSTPSRQL